MRIPVNLASQPFRHDRALLIGSSVLAAIMFGTLFMLTSLIRVDRINKAESTHQLAIAQKQLAAVMKDQSSIDAQLRQPQNAAVLEYSILLNQILLRKGISWTRIFSDLEKTLPYNVRIIQIRPQVTGDNKIFLQMVVGADNTQQLDDFVHKLEASDVFGATMVYNVVPPSQTDPLFRYTVSVRYAQKL
jgi:type IV pilus assembly protein PilN